MKNNTKNKILYLCQGAMIAALYVVLTYIANALGLANYAIQVRFSEALCIMPVFTTAAIPGLFVGCVLANTLTGCAIWDIVFGSIATLIGAIGTRLLRKTTFAFTLPPVIANALIVPFILRYVYGLGDSHWFLVFTVAAGEIISVCILGLGLKHVLSRNKDIIFDVEN